MMRNESGAATRRTGRRRPSTTSSACRSAETPATPSVPNGNSPGRQLPSAPIGSAVTVGWPSTFTSSVRSESPSDR